MVWLMRCRHSRGFGVQSPWAYAFIRYVVNEHSPYYGYGELERRYARETAVRRKLGRLYFRMANHAQPRRWGCCTDGVDMMEDYVRGGCRRTEVVDCVQGYELERAASCDVLVMTLERNWGRIFEAFANGAQAQSVLVVEDIHATAAARRAWRAMAEDGRSGVTFDLYYCGIVFFDPKMHKQHYVVNF